MHQSRLLMSAFAEIIQLQEALVIATLNILVEVSASCTYFPLHTATVLKFLI